MILDDYQPFEGDGNKHTTTSQQHNTQPPTFNEENLAGNMQQQIPPYNQNSQGNQVYGAGATQISTAELQVNLFCVYCLKKLSFYFCICTYLEETRGIGTKSSRIGKT